MWVKAVHPESWGHFTTRSCQLIAHCTLHDRDVFIVDQQRQWSIKKESLAFKMLKHASEQQTMMSVGEHSIVSITHDLTFRPAPMHEIIPLLVGRAIHNNRKLPLCHTS